MTTMLLGIISCQDRSEADIIGRHLQKHKLAACMQIVDSVESSFLWPPGSSAIDYANEALLLVKTLEPKWAALEKEVLKKHSYKNPEIVAIPVSHVSRPYLDWLTNELA